MQSIVTTMGEVNKNTQEIAGAVQQQSAATSEISHSVRQPRAVPRTWWRTCRA
jgi:methyl-accepting chemotaxis protein